MVGTVAAMLNDCSNKGNYHYFVHCHPTWLWWHQLQTIYQEETLVLQLCELFNASFRGYFVLKIWGREPNRISMTLFIVFLNSLHLSGSQVNFTWLCILVWRFQLPCWSTHRGSERTDKEQTMGGTLERRPVDKTKERTQGTVGWFVMLQTQDTVGRYKR